MRILYYTEISIYFVFCLYSCAIFGEGPPGGDYDIEPPKFIRSNPPQHAIRVNQSKITLFFNKYITIQKSSEKVIVSPPQKKNSSVKPIGKKITVELKDSLIANTTYTFDFKDGIIDNNEGNALKDFSFAFSTGDVVDSLCISGILLNAENLEPVPNIIIGIHSNLDDTAFVTLPFLRITQTDETGHFQVKNIADGTYHIFALNDINRNFKFDSPSESLAFEDSLIIPSFYLETIFDTIRKDSATIDTVKITTKTHFTPDHIILRLFKEDFQSQYLYKKERISDNRWEMDFHSEVHIFPEIRLLNEEKKKWYILELSPDKKKLIYWITDSTIYTKNTLQIEAIYQVTDTLHRMKFVTDTLRLEKKEKEFNHHFKKGINKKFLDIQIYPERTMEIFDTVKIVFSEPILSFRENWIQIKQKMDTLWEICPFSIVRDSLNPRIYLIHYPWKYSYEYRIFIDSAAISSIYNHENHAIRTQFKIKSENDYGHLTIKVIGAESIGFGQLLDKSENVIRETILKDNQLIFHNISPGRYFLRYIEDTNANGKWDTGNYSEKKQPEELFYFPSALEIKRLMEWEQTWNLKEIPADKQKPLEIAKNKSKEKSFQK